ncbi:MAG: FecR domain-containing protein [Bacteroidales bacterium]
MNKNILIKFFNREASEQEADYIMKWLEKSPQNLEYFAQLRVLHTISHENSTAIKKITATMKSSAELISQANRAAETNSEKKQQRLVPIKFLYLSIAAAIIALFFSIGLLLTETPIMGKLQKNAHSVMVQNTYNTIRTLYTEKGVKGFITLPDGSKVWLNSDSKLTYPDKFDTHSRNVKIEGEAYFDVKKDSLCPMIVTTNKDFTIEVYGTTFNIRSYSDDSKAEATLYSGAITMRYKKNAKDQILQLHPNESFVYSGGTQSVLTQTNHKVPENQAAWKTGKLIFDNTPVEEAIKTLERWHGTKFIIHNKGIYKHRISAEFTSESIVQIMEILQIPLSVSYTYADNVVRIR